jgi:hypothetical protein
MKNKSNAILMILIGVVIGLLVSLIVVLVTKDKETVDKDETIVTYFNDVSSAKEESKLKKGFISIVDFLFYKGEIKNIKLSDIKDETKLKLAEITLKIDEKISEKFPDYKSTISDKYNNIKEKVVTMYVDTTDRICDSNQDLCDKAKEMFGKLKNGFNITVDYLKDLGEDIKDRLNNWYQNYKAN